MQSWGDQVVERLRPLLCNWKSNDFNLTWHRLKELAHVSSLDYSFSVLPLEPDTLLHFLNDSWSHLTFLNTLLLFQTQLCTPLNCHCCWSCQVEVKGKTMEGKGGPKCSNTGGKIRRTKGELYLKLLQKPKADQKSKRQSSKQNIKTK